MIADGVARWSSGDDLVVAWPGGVALLDASVGLDAAERIWSRLRREPQLGTFLKTLAESSDAGFLDLPPFAIALLEANRCHVAVRGAWPVQIVAGGVPDTLSGEGITTWAEKVVAEPEAVHLGPTAAGSPAGPIADGVVHGGSVTLGELVPMHKAAVPETPMQETPMKETPAPERFLPAAVVEEAAAAEVRRSAPEPVVAVQPPAPEIGGEFRPATLLEPADIPDIPAAPVADLPDGRTPTGETTLMEAEEASGKVPEEAPEPEVNPYASLWDHSIAMDVQAAAIRGEIEEVTPAATPSPEPRPGPSSADQLSGETVVDEGMVQVVMSMLKGGPQVLARFCDRGHANPPERATCFVCGSVVSGDARTTDRPQLGWIRVEGGETIPLKGPIVAGRSPKSTAVKLDETPRLVALPHPHVSGTHLAILIEGWRILAKDLRSSNGTYLRRHGKPPVRLPESPVPLVAGDLIDLGKGLFIHLDRIP